MLGLVLTFVLALAACSDDSGAESPGNVETQTTPSSVAESSSTAPPATSTTTTVPGPAGVPDSFARTLVEIDGTSYNVAVADTPDKLSLGLMGVEDLSPLDGMLFVYGSERPISHWMKNTLIPLDIAFFDADGMFVSKTTMVPCLDESDDNPCAVYPADGPAAFSVEVAAGVFDDLPDDARLVIVGSLDGNGKEI